MKVLITGGRDYSDFDAFEKAIEMLSFKIELIIHGGARGADSIADMWAKKHSVFVMRMDALWNAHGKGGRTEAKLGNVKLWKTRLLCCVSRR